MEKSNRYPKSWYDIQADFEEMQKMSCAPQNIRKVPHNFMLVPKCKSGRIICHEKCGGAGNEAE